MTYDDRPLWEQQKEANKTASEQFAKPKMHKSAHAPSPLLGWHLQESAKRKEGKYNEIDGNELKAALKGVKNRWFSLAQNHKKLCEEFFSKLEGKNKNYDRAKQIWLELNNLIKTETYENKSESKHVKEPLSAVTNKLIN